MLRPCLSAPRIRADPNQAAAAIVDLATGELAVAPETPETATRRKNPAGVALGRMGGKKGGKARAAKLAPERRVEIASKAAASRWQRR